LFTLADELKISGDHIALSKIIETELESSAGRKLPINVDGAIAAIISDMGFDYRLGKAFFLLGRVAGLTSMTVPKKKIFPEFMFFNLENLI